MSQDEDTHQKIQMVMEQAIQALENVPEVGDVYDQQHADTHMQAAIELRGLIGKGPAPGTAADDEQAGNLLTAEQQRQYLARRGNACPWCGRPEIEGTGKTNSDADWHENEVECKSCGAVWLDIYTISGVQGVSGPADKAIRKAPGQK